MTARQAPIGLTHPNPSLWGRRGGFMAALACVRDRIGADERYISSLGLRGKRTHTRPRPHGCGSRVQYVHVEYRSRRPKCGVRWRGWSSPLAISTRHSECENLNAFLLIRHRRRVFLRAGWRRCVAGLCGVSAAVSRATGAQEMLT